MEIEVRKGNVHDLNDVFELIKELALYENAEGEVKIDVETLKNSFIRPNPCFDFIVAESKKQIIGIALYYERFSTWKGPYLYLEDLIVSQSHRRKGIGQLIFKQLLEVAKNGGYKKLCWQVLDWNEMAINFYKKYNTDFDGEWIDCTLDEDQIKTFAI